MMTFSYYHYYYYYYYLFLFFFLFLFVSVLTSSSSSSSSSSVVDRRRRRTTTTTTTKSSNNNNAVLPLPSSVPSSSYTYTVDTPAKCGECYCIIDDDDDDVDDNDDKNNNNNDDDNNEHNNNNTTTTTKQKKTCPNKTKPPDKYPQQIINYFFHSLELLNPYELKCNPYKDVNCETYPPQYNNNNNNDIIVCAIKYKEDDDNNKDDNKHEMMMTKMLKTMTDGVYDVDVDDDDDADAASLLLFPPMVLEKVQEREEEEEGKDGGGRGGGGGGGGGEKALREQQKRMLRSHDSDVVDDHDDDDISSASAAAAAAVAPKRTTMMTNNCSSSYQYSLITYPNRYISELNNATVTHMGACGVCSTTQDLAVYMSYPDMTTLGTHCGTEAILNEKLGIQCFQKLGMTEECARIWVYNSLNTAKQCKFQCLYTQKIVHLPNNGPPPKCKLNKCLKCDEINSGPIFKQFAGRTRRNSGLLSNIVRPCNSIATDVIHSIPSKSKSCHNHTDR